MRYIAIDSASVGMVLARPILDEIGRVLIAKDVVLTDAYIERLENLGVGGIYISDELSDDIDIDETLSPVLKSAGFAAVKSKNIDQCLVVAKEIVRELLAKGKVCMDMNDLKTFDNYTYAHSVNVAVFACTIGFGMKLNERELEDLVLAGLLHDLGKLNIPEEILNKPSRLSPEEFGMIKAHPVISYEMIKERIDISAMTKNAVYSHHENYDGSGYPKKISGKEITKLAAILHVVDVYDALISRRPYKAPYSPYAAIEILQGGSGTLYDPDIVEAMIANFPIYPKGTMIQIDGALSGLVIENREDHNLRPIVRLEDRTEIDLSLPENLHYVITMPSDQDYVKIMEEEQLRKDMIRDLVRRTVLIIDSDKQLFAELKQKLSGLYDFVHVETDSLAEGFVRRYGLPDLVITDVDNRNVKESESFKGLMGRNSKLVPVIVLGSYSDLDTIVRLKNIGINNYVLKPYKLIYLQSEIDRAMKYGVIK